MVDLAFHHIALNCKDLAAVERFYTRHFGVHRARFIRTNGQIVLFLRSSGCYLELFEASQGPPLPSATGSSPGYPG